MHVILHIGYFCKKNLNCLTDNIEIFHIQMKSRPKKDQKTIFFVSGAIHCENTIWNIQIFASIFMSSNICWGRFGRTVQLVPKTLEVWREKVKRKHRYMWSFVYPINSSYKYVKKVKLNPNYNPNIFSEIIELQENGGSGGIQAKIPNCTVYIGIAA